MLVSADKFRWHTVQENQIGLPFRGLAHCRELIVVMDTANDAGNSLPPPVMRGLWTGELPLIGRFAVPCYPLWPGFALNTLFYAAIAWGLWQLPLALRRRRRVRRGQCPTCGYNRAGLAPEAVCPECGAASKSPPL